MALAGLPVSRVAAYEPPWAVGDAAGRNTGLADRVAALLDEGRNEDAVERFLTDGPGLPPHVVARMRQHMAHLAPSLPYDLALAGDQALPAAELATIGVPALLMAGGASDAWARDTVAAVADAIPGAEHRTLAGQTHGVDAAVVAPLLDEFLRSVIRVVMATPIAHMGGARQRRISTSSTHALVSPPSRANPIAAGSQ